MQIGLELALMKVFTIDTLKLCIYMDKYANLFWSVRGERLLPINALPWKYQKIFYFKFLHDDGIAAKFKEMEIIGAIDLYIKSTHVQGKPLDLEPVETS
ncbi:MAG: hypothetical protein AAF348_19840 [Bacteroidota bacterium]